MICQTTIYVWNISLAASFCQTCSWWICHKKNQTVWQTSDEFALIMMNDFLSGQLHFWLIHEKQNSCLPVQDRKSLKMLSLNNAHIFVFKHDLITCTVLISRKWNEREMQMQRQQLCQILENTSDKNKLSNLFE